MKTFTLDQIVRQASELTREAVDATIAGDGKRALEALDRGGGRVVEAIEATDRYKAMASDYAGLSKAERVRYARLSWTRPARDARR